VTGVPPLRYPTFCALAGVDASDPVLVNGTVHDIDGVNVWPLLTGANLTQVQANPDPTLTLTLTLTPTLTLTLSFSDSAYASYASYY
jgi:hypothetical protein